MHLDRYFKPYLLAEVANKYNMSLESIDLVKPSKIDDTSDPKIIPASRSQAEKEIMKNAVGADTFSNIPSICINRTRFTLSSIGKGMYITSSI